MKNTEKTSIFVACCRIKHLTVGYFAHKNRIMFYGNIKTKIIRTVL